MTVRPLIWGLWVVAPDYEELKISPWHSYRLQRWYEELELSGDRRRPLLRGVASLTWAQLATPAPGTVVAPDYG